MQLQNVEKFQKHGDNVTVASSDGGISRVLVNFLSGAFLPYIHGYIYIHTYTRFA